MQQKVAFVINPNAGVKKNINIEQFIKSNFSKTIAFDLITWDNKDDFQPIKVKLLAGNYTTIVACGGDGTVNQVASVVINTNIALGILPLGSGNGLARSNGIPIDLLKALQVIEKNNTRKMDSATINGIPFFCTAGIGFDAHIANIFAISSKRGFSTYFKTSIKEYFNYKPNEYTLVVDGQQTHVKAFILTIANAGQWGNDVYISPEAELNDGILRVSVLKPFSNFSIPSIGLKLFTKKIHTSSHFISLKGKSIQITFEGNLPVHFDGEPIAVKDKIDIKVIPLSLNVVC